MLKLLFSQFGAKIFAMRNLCGSKQKQIFSREFLRKQIYWPSKIRTNLFPKDISWCINFILHGEKEFCSIRNLIFQEKLGILLVLKCCFSQ